MTLFKAMSKMDPSIGTNDATPPAGSALDSDRALGLNSDYGQMRIVQEKKDMYLQENAYFMRRLLEVMALQFDEEFLTQSSNGSYYLDLKKAVVSQLVGAGVPEENIEVSPICNKCDADNFFSYRREGSSAGRMWGLIRLEV